MAEGLSTSENLKFSKMELGSSLGLYHCVALFKVLSFSFFLSFFLAVLGLHCCVRAFSRCGKRGLLFIAVHGLLIAMASLVAEHGL